MLYLGKICEVKEGLSVVRVDYLGTITPFIPYLAIANKFKRHFIPPRVGEAVILCDFGGAKVAMPSIFNHDYKEPSGASSTKEIISYEDGTILSYDTSTSTLEILSPKIININVQNDINITCENANLTATNTTITSPSVLIKGNTTIQGAINTAGAGGSTGTFSINGNLDIKGNLNTTGSITTAGSITDSRGDLTNHTNNGYARD
ncbi:phage baseplate assembly protein V [Campylobacter mucosalis]|uniref:Phage baseplate assembly protein V n=1 Tax=Campylobacter mucosalis CCUG 21559 TaxID=1032067 RepID=A0A6G5QFQ9_9BACT|nr:phage baseplate assembly protein V [Campylobacter mucosalis]QCD44454.1 phage baseplate assembly protein V [Campylobacter mucosalis CCUG 21559]